jgi:hypothetical protein
MLNSHMVEVSWGPLWCLKVLVHCSKSYRVPLDGLCSHLWTRSLLRDWERFSPQKSDLPIRLALPQPVRVSLRSNSSFSFLLILLIPSSLHPAFPSYLLSFLSPLSYCNFWQYLVLPYERTSFFSPINFLWGLSRSPHFWPLVFQPRK